MDIKRILTDIAKAYLTKKPILVGDLNGRTAISLDGFVAYFLTDEQFPFDKSRLLRGAKPFNFKGVIPSVTTEAVLTEELRQTKNGVAQRLTDGKTDVWVLVGLLKNFFTGTATFMICTPYTAVLIYEKDELVGLVMPTNV